ncbi:MAG TPA: Bax inhibitor-1/YccA family protein [Actinomycetes bacterium]|nr:Bax inhibitor-1/YccA family protein [Actinomycetes bacterium]
MESRNPVIARMEKEAQRNGGYADFGATATATAAAPTGSGTEPLAPPRQAQPLGAPMTINDVIVRTAAMFVPLLITAYITWTMELSYGYVLIAMLVGLGLGLWGALSSKVRPAVYLAYAAVEGVVIGGLSLWFQTWVDESNFAQGQPTTNIVIQAVIGTFAAFAAVLFLYATRIIKVTGKFKKFMLIAMTAYLGIAVVSLITALFGVGDGWGFFGVDGIGLLLCVAGVALAAFSLALDFDAIEQGVAAGLPEQESWRAAFGLTVTLIWLYLEILRFLAILNSD